MKNSFPAAMPPPTTPVTYITSSIVDEAKKVSKESPRKRIIVPFHKEDQNSLHRMFNVVQPNTYIIPHYHLSANKCEALVVLEGSICFITFDENGTITSHQNIKAGSPIFGVDLEPDIIHTFIVLEHDTVIFEVKPGPYDKATDKEFMPWAPLENTAEANDYVKELYQLTQND